MNRATWACLTFFLLLNAAVGEEPPASCPVQFQKVDPHSYPFTSEMLGSDKDPWDHYLRIEYKNVSVKTILAIRFGVAFVDALGDSKESVYSYTSSDVVHPNKTAKPYWGDGVFFHEYGYKMGATAWIEKVRFSDDTFFIDDGAHSCSFPKPAALNPNPQATKFGTAPTIAKTPEGDSQQVRENSEAAKGSMAAAAELANAGHVRSPQELLDLVRNGQASKCAVVTVPPGAQVVVDGNNAGISPLVFVLLRTGDNPRIITVKMEGYKTVEQKVLPDGKTIPIGITLEKR